MPVLDMPLKELVKYQGSSPCPDDIDVYWDRALKELDATEPNNVFIKSEFQVPGYECYDLFFDGVRNGKIHCKFIKPDKIDNKAPALLSFHGYTDSAPSWMNLISYAAMGFVVCAMDVRGQGGKSHDLNPVCGSTLQGHIVKGLDDEDADNMFYRQIFLDTAMVAKIVMNLDYVDEQKVCAMGGSQGGALTVACASLVPGIAKAVFQYPFLCDYKRVWDMDMAERAYVGIKEYFRHFDPMHERENEIFMKLGYIDLQNISKRIKAKCMMITGLMDDICPPSTQFAMYNKITSEKEYKIFYEFGHEYYKEADDITCQFLLFNK